MRTHKDCLECLAVYLLTDHDIPEDSNFYVFHGSEIEICGETYQWMEIEAEPTHNLPTGLLFSLHDRLLTHHFYSELVQTHSGF